MFYALADRLRGVLEKCWSGSMLGPPDFVRCRSGLGNVFISRRYCWEAAGEGGVILTTGAEVGLRQTELRLVVAIGGH